MTTTTTTAEAEAYLEAVRAELDDLSGEERGELLEDLVGHLAEVSADPDDSTPLLVRLGSPVHYAAELRTAAGLPPRAGRTAARGRLQVTRPLREWAVVRRASEAWRHEWTQAGFAFARELRPAWWVVRAYVAVVMLAAIGGLDREDLPIPHVAGSRAFGLALMIGAVIVSVQAGRRASGTKRTVAVGLANAILGFAALVLFLMLQLLATSVQYVAVPTSSTAYALQSPHGPVTNIHPYARDGTPLHGVLLFDQDGRPLRTAEQRWWADGCDRVIDHPRAADGVPVEFSYPHDYVALPSTGQRCAVSPSAPEVPLPELPAPSPDAHDETPASGPAGEDAPAAAGD